LDWVYDTFKDDFVLRIMLAYTDIEEGKPEKSYTDIMNLASEHGIDTRVDSSESLKKTLDSLYNRVAIFSSVCIVKKVEEFAEMNDKKVLYILSSSTSSIVRRLKDEFRFDQEFVDFLRSKRLTYVDLLEAHVTDFAKFNISIEDYIKRYYIGHYSPLGNFFQAFAIKDKIIEMLEPKPISYRTNTC
jgi:DNA-dependent RNA polymerase auxiliary subunit epsilon